MRIITDSTCDIELGTIQNLGVSMVPLKVNFGTTQYSDKYEITNEKFYELLETSEELPTTALANTDDFINEFNKYDGDIVGIFIASKLSGTYQAACIAKETLGRDNIYLIDSTTTTAGLGVLIHRAVELRDAGKSAKEIYETIEHLKTKINVYAIIDTLKYLVKGGRLSKTQGIIGGILGVKPIIIFKDGVVENIGKARGTEKAIDFLIERIKNQHNFDESEPLAFAYSKSDSTLHLLTDKFRQSKNYDEHAFYSIGSVIGTHTGPNIIGIVFFDK